MPDSHVTHVNFCYGGWRGRIWSIYAIDTDLGTIQRLVINCLYSQLRHEGSNFRLADVAVDRIQRVVCRRRPSSKYHTVVLRSKLARERTRPHPDFK